MGTGKMLIVGRRCRVSLFDCKVYLVFVLAIFLKHLIENTRFSTTETTLPEAKNDSEFLVWLEQVKNNTKLKRKFLIHMGIIKAEQ